jgi:hypothetical protein
VVFVSWFLARPVRCSLNLQPQRCFLDTTTVLVERNPNAMRNPLKMCGFTNRTIANSSRIDELLVKEE